jgi:hypothetical protein
MSDKPTLRSVCITFEPQDLMSLEPFSQDAIEFNPSTLRQPQEIKVTYEWQPHPIFYVGLKVRIEGVLCEVCSVEKDGSITVQMIEEVGE